MSTKGDHGGEVEVSTRPPSSRKESKYVSVAMAPKMTLLREDGPT